MIGDSTTTGWGSGTTDVISRNTTGAHVLAPPAVARASLNTGQLKVYDAVLTPNNRVALTGASYDQKPIWVGYDSRLTLGTSWAVATEQMVLGGNRARSAGTDALTFAPGFVFNRIELLYVMSPGLGDFTVDVGGSVLQTVQTAGAAQIGKVVVISPLGSSPVNVRRAAGGNVEILNIRVWNTAEASVAVANYGSVGATTADHIVATDPWSPLNMIAAVGAHLWTIMLGANDIFNGVAVSTYKANLQTLITACKASGADVLLISPTPASGSYNIPGTYVTALSELVTENSLPPLLDINALFGSYAASAADYFDSVHLKASGSSRVGQAVAQRVAADAVAPSITSAAVIDAVEGSPKNHTLTANEIVTWSKTGGADAGLFTLAGSTLSLPSQTYAPGGDNDRVVQVTATDSAGNATSQTITFNIQQVTALWTPAALGTADVAWFRASDQATVTESGGNVSAVANKGAYGGSLQQATGTAPAVLHRQRAGEQKRRPCGERQEPGAGQHGSPGGAHLLHGRRQTVVRERQRGHFLDPRLMGGDLRLHRRGRQRQQADCRPLATSTWPVLASASAGRRLPTPTTTQPPQATGRTTRCM
jgi:lysophospholipase L1-like esterase